MKLLTSQIAGIAAAACALVASPVRAAPSTQVPLPLGLHANAQYEAGGRPLVLRFAKPARVITGLHCRIAQGDDADADEPADDMKNPQPACVFRSFAGPDPAYKPGPAKIQISARIHGEWVEGPVLPIVIAAADVTPKGGAGKKFDAHYWLNTGGGEGQLHIDDARVKNGGVELSLWVGNIRMGSLRAVIERDGLILSQTFPVTAGKPKKGVQIFDEERAEAEATRSVVVSGQISDTIEGRELRLEIDGPKIDDSQRKLTARLIKDGDKGTQNSACYVKWDTQSHCPGED